MAFEIAHKAKTLRKALEARSPAHEHKIYEPVAS